MRLKFHETVSILATIIEFGVFGRASAAKAIGIVSKKRWAKLLSVTVHPRAEYCEPACVTVRQRTCPRKCNEKVWPRRESNSDHPIERRVLAHCAIEVSAGLSTKLGPSLSLSLHIIEKTHAVLGACWTDSNMMITPQPVPGKTCETAIAYPLQSRKKNSFFSMFKI